MSQHDFDITTFDANTGTTMRAAINAALQSLAGLSSGATAPGTTYPFQWWMDTSTTPMTLRQRNSANTAWVVIGTISAAGAVVLANAATVGGFTPSQTPGANQIPVLTTYGDLAIGSKTVLSTQGSADTVNFYGGNTYANLSATGNAIVTANAYTDIDNQWHYSSNGSAAIVDLQSNGMYTFRTAPTGTAGAAISFDAPKTIYHTGNDTILPHTDELSLKIVRGNVNGAGGITAGSGYTVTKNTTGDYTITFSTPFSGIPTVTVTTFSGYSAMVASLANGSVRISTGEQISGSSGMVLADTGFGFTAIGPR